MVVLEAIRRNAPLAGRVALVTGANKGIGFAVARGLARAGLAVIVGSRDPARGRAAVEQLRNDGLTAVSSLGIDLSDDESITAAATTIDTEIGRLDVLVNNAAIKLEHHPCPPSQVNLDDVRATFATNVFGTMAVTQAMLPLLRRSTSARIVNVSSGLGSLTLASTEGSVYRDRPLLGYNTTKAAINALTLQFANELRDTTIKINAVDPGYVRTDMTRQDGSRTPEQGAAVVLTYALLADDGPSGGFFDQRGPVPW